MLPFLYELVRLTVFPVITTTVAIFVTWWWQQRAYRLLRKRLQSRRPPRPRLALASHAKATRSRTHETCRLPALMMAHDAGSLSKGS